MPEVHVHYGSYDSIPQAASPGLVFLRKFLPALDSLQPSLNPISPFLAPTATFIMNGNSSQPVDQILPMLDTRSKHLAKFHHKVTVAWDIEQEDDGSSRERRTVMYESSSITVFKHDPEKLEISVREFNIVELERSKEAGGDEQGFVAVELRSYMDAGPIKERAATIKFES
jgi:hypothetical protein